MVDGWKGGGCDDCFFEPSFMLSFSWPSLLDVAVFKTARLGDNCTANDEQ